MLLNIVRVFICCYICCVCVFTLSSISTSVWDSWCSPERSQQPSENESELISRGFMLLSAEATAVRKIDLLCDGVFALWFLIISVSYKGKTCSLIFEGQQTWCLLCLRTFFCCSHTDDVSIWGHAKFTELFVKECTTLYKEQGTGKNGRRPIIMTYLRVSLSLINYL